MSPPARYWLWVLGLLLQVAGQVIAFRRWTPPESQGGEAVIAVTGSLVERLDLFVIIVLGEVIVARSPAWQGSSCSTWTPLRRNAGGAGRHRVVVDLLRPGLFASRSPDTASCG